MSNASQPKISLFLFEYASTLLLSAFTLKETTCSKICSKSWPKSEKVHFRLACVGRSTTNFVPRVLSYPLRRAGRREPWERGWSTTSLLLYKLPYLQPVLPLQFSAIIHWKVMHVYFLRFFVIFAGPRFVEIQVMLPWQREVTLFLSITF